MDFSSWRPWVAKAKVPIHLMLHDHSSPKRERHGTALPEPFTYGLPRNPHEVRRETPELDRDKVDILFKLRDICATILEINSRNINSNDNFVALGGDSLLALKLVALSSEQGITITLRDVFRSDNLVMLARRARDSAKSQLHKNIVSSQKAEGFCDSNDIPPQILAQYPDIQKQTIEEVNACSRMQRRIMSLSTEKPKTHNIKLAYQLSYFVDVVHFRDAWKRVIHLSPNLRTRIVWLAQGMSQITLGDDDYEMKSAPSLSAFFERADEIIGHFGAPLFTYALVYGGNDAWFFGVVIHQSIIDGWSLRLIFDALRRGYEVGMQSAMLPYDKVPSFTTPETYRAAADFWRSELANAKKATFPELPPSNPDYVPAIRQFSSTMSLWGHRELGLSVTTANLIRTAWALTLGFYSKMGDITFGATVHGRLAPVPGLCEMVGSTIVSVPVRVNLSKDLPLTELCRQVQSKASEMVIHEHFGLDDIADMHPEHSDLLKFSSIIIVQSADDLSLVCIKEGTKFLIPVGPVDLLRQEVTQPDQSIDPGLSLVLNAGIYEDNVKTVFIYDSKILHEEQIGELSTRFEYYLSTLLRPRNMTVGLIDKTPPPSPASCGQAWSSEDEISGTETDPAPAFIASPLSFPELLMEVPSSFSYSGFIEASEVHASHNVPPPELKPGAKNDRLSGRNDDNPLLDTPFLEMVSRPRNVGSRQQSRAVDSHARQSNSPNELFNDMCKVTTTPESTIQKFQSPKSTDYSNSSDDDLDSEMLSRSISSEDPDVTSQTSLDLVILDVIAKSILEQYRNHQIRSYGSGGDFHAKKPLLETTDATRTTEETLLTTVKAIPGKRHRSSDSDGSDQDSRISNAKRMLTQFRKKQLACPFWKLNNNQYRACFSKKLTRIRDVKQHLTRRHTPKFYCERCLVVFVDKDSHSCHLREECVHNPDGFLEGITHQQHWALSKRSDPRVSEEEQWHSIWDIIFPNLDRPPSAYLDADLSRDLCEFREYAQKHGPNIMERMLETEISEEERRCTLLGIITKGLDSIFEDWLSASGQQLSPESKCGGRAGGQDSGAASSPVTEPAVHNNVGKQDQDLFRASGLTRSRDETSTLIQGRESLGGLQTHDGEMQSSTLPIEEFGEGVDWNLNLAQQASESEQMHLDGWDAEAMANWFSENEWLEEIKKHFED